jgi:hypothetical protein
MASVGRELVEAFWRRQVARLQAQIDRQQAPPDFPGGYDNWKAMRDHYQFLGQERPATLHRLESGFIDDSDDIPF